MSDDLRARLARLRREPPSSAAGAEVGLEQRSTLPAWFAARRTALPEPARGDELPGAPRAVAAPADLECERNARGEFAIRRTLLPFEQGHGDVPLAEVLGTRGDVYAWLTGDPALERLVPESAVFLDIETTGLSGGAGTIPFLVALGRFTPRGFELWQAFLREPREEAAALTAVAERIGASSGVVSFFGKSFDRHRLEDKMRLHRIAPPFDARPHLDLYHPLRRLYRGATVDGRLATYERELCGVERGFDLPGRYAPEAWFDFLGGRAHRLEGVFRHNALDVLSLVTLMAHLARAPHGTRADGQALAGCARSRGRGLAERHAAERNYGAAIERLEEALKHERLGEAPEGLDQDERTLRFRRAEYLRKARRLEEALEAFLALAGERDAPLGPEAWVQVQKLSRRLKRPIGVQAPQPVIAATGHSPKEE